MEIEKNIYVEKAACMRAKEFYREILKYESNEYRPDAASLKFFEKEFEGNPQGTMLWAMEIFNENMENFHVIYSLLQSLSRVDRQKAMPHMATIISAALALDNHVDVVVCEECKTSGPVERTISDALSSWEIIAEKLNRIMIKTPEK